MFRICGFCCLATFAGATAGAEGCKPGDVRAVVGKPYSGLLAERARREAGAGSVQKIEPGRAYQMQWISDRLNIRVDGRGIVTALFCG